MKTVRFYIYATLVAAWQTFGRPVRAMIIAYGYVLRGEKVTTPMKWSDI